MPRRQLAPLTERQVTVPQAAELLQVHPATVRRMISRGELRAYRIGRHVRIDPLDLDRTRDQIAPTTYQARRSA